jgi:hypothetical protein
MVAGILPTFTITNDPVPPIPPTWSFGPWPRVRRSTLKKYGNAANSKQCAKRRAKNKAARKARNRNRR